jgi:hypothetical protein
MSQQLAPFLVVLFGGGIAVAALVTLLNGSHRTALRTVLLAFGMAVGVFIVVVLFPVAKRARRNVHADDAFMEADVSSVRLIHPPEPPQEIDRGRIARAEYTYQGLGRSQPMSVVIFYDGRDTELATWTIYPLVGRRVGAWFNELGIATTVRRRPN